MDTAKVDIRKLQLLNDRINQCIDALSQVRLSVHGLAHSSQQQPNLGFAGQGSPWGQQQVYGQPFGQYQQGTGYPGQQSQAFGGFPQVGGFAHTNWGQQPFHPFQQGPQTTGSPWQQTLGFGGQTGYYGQQGQFGQSPYGLSHTSPETEHYNRVPLSDPFMAMRIAQTSPYAQLAVPPYPQSFF
jgi:hypothetical protein